MRAGERCQAIPHERRPLTRVLLHLLHSQHAAPSHPAGPCQALALHNVNADFTLDAMLGALPTGLTALELAACVFKGDWGEGRGTFETSHVGWTSETRA